jgi:DNA replication protein DnaC
MLKKNKLHQQINDYLRELNISDLRGQYIELGKKAQQESMSYEEYLLELLQIQFEIRHTNRINRYLKESRIPVEKNIDTFDLKRLPRKISNKVRTLLSGSFADNKENILAFGNPGSGKTHLLCAIGQKLIRDGRRIYFTTCSTLVQNLLIAKKDLKLSKILKKLSRYEVIIIDDIGYVQQSREEMEVLFTLLAERYERGSIMLTSNLPFSKWERIFKDPMVTAAAIDRLVHHSVILELNLPSYRMADAKILKDKEVEHQK